MLRAIAAMEQPMPTRIISDGPERAALEALEAQLQLGQVVQFLGYVGDAELVELYAGARGVYYAPYDEDYGFTTVQALAAARPVITSSDAGGVLELVEDGVNGLVSDPHPAALARALDRLHDGALVARLGAAGPPRVADIRWSRVVAALLEAAR
jgi:glycosyltransferase involved in cell wall biosynthesis